MNNHLTTAEKIILSPAEISDKEISKILSILHSSNIDYSDLYFQNSWSESWVLEDGIVKDGNFGVNRGVGIRAIDHDKVGFAYSDDLVLPALETAAKAAKSISIVGGNNNIKAWDKPIISSPLYATDNPLLSIEDADKISLLQKADSLARAKSPCVKQVVASLASSYTVILVAASDGTYAADIRPLVRFNISVVVEKDGRREQASFGGGGRYSLDEFIKSNSAEEFSSEAVRQAFVALEAIPAPAGPMKVVLGSGWPGVLLHEAIGHGLEGDFNRKGSSAFSNRLGEVVASKHCTVVDDGTLKARRGSLNIDDEGIKTQCTTLIENGVLKNYMQDKLNAKLMGQKSTGNGRRESYAHPTLPRMTNTYMLPGKHTKDEIISSVDKGIYAVNFGGGQVDITSGKFVFNANEAYLIENGKVTQPIKGATLIGNGPDILNKVSMVGDNLELDRGVGVCGKDGQNVPVGVGQPTILVDEITVGGTN